MTTLSANQLESFMREQCFAQQIFIADKLYALPDLNWLRTEFPLALRRFYRQMLFNGWQPEQSDCDDFARGAAFFASVLHNKMEVVPACALAFGEFWYARAEDNQDHAINCAIVNVYDVLHLIAFEPQRALAGADPIIQLTPQERNLCLGYRF